MPKGEHTMVSTALDVTHVKGILSSVLSGATVEPLNQGPLDGNAALAILASQRGVRTRASVRTPTTSSDSNRSVSRARVSVAVGPKTADQVQRT